ncbi:EF-hand domain-containing protein [Defluviimonas sp. D31]|uniref:EF-hand domain-containing protein n=1 Tax=Defluviimonas sp. D31 TaxID=3083253 RepID=UPI00296F7394|nr:EF-hand domain-containing protein [Defluviimonas sp. D31]MDW4550361.1 EF-hand domain-containing protein [Defluviimonas sp. D31]
MIRKSLLAALALSVGAAALAAPTVLAAHDRGFGRGGKSGHEMRGGMMGHGMMGGMMGMGGMMAGPGLDFAELDADGDGKITEEEFRAHRQAEIAGLDADGDNLISAEELAAHIAKRMQARAEVMAKLMLESRDLDGDGKLGAAEMLAMPMPERMFGFADADGDGVVSEDEFDAAHERMGRRGAMHRMFAPDAATGEEGGTE